jgi:hypothetical protein
MIPTWRIVLGLETPTSSTILMVLSGNHQAAALNQQFFFYTSFCFLSAHFWWFEHHHIQSVESFLRHWWIGSFELCGALQPPVRCWGPWASSWCTVIWWKCRAIQLVAPCLVWNLYDLACSCSAERVRILSSCHDVLWLKEQRYLKDSKRKMWKLLREPSIRLEKDRRQGLRWSKIERFETSAFLGSLGS